MWVNVFKRDNKALEGFLNNDPFDMPYLKAGASISFFDYHIMGIDWGNSRTSAILANLSKQKIKQNWERCLVDACVVNDGIQVQYIYREEPNMGSEDDKYPDSGWRIRGDVSSMTDEQYENEKPLYVALGKVLNSDDSFVHLLDSAPGSRFFKNTDTGVFEVDTDNQ